MRSRREGLPNFRPAPTPEAQGGREPHPGVMLDVSRLIVAGAASGRLRGLMLTARSAFDCGPAKPSGGPGMRDAGVARCMQHSISRAYCGAR